MAQSADQAGRGQRSESPGSSYKPPDSADVASLEERLRAALVPNLLLARSIGSGGMAHVFLAREPALKRLVAVKVLSGDLASSEAGRARFEREAQAVAGLSHPNIVAIHSVGELDDGTPYFVMQYVEGRSMANRVAQEGPLAVPEARRALGEVAAALAAAHKQGIIHRDIKPANILYEEATGRSLVSDFGIAALNTPDQTAPAPMKLTGTGVLVGTPQYMSPEQLLAEPISEKTDIYSLGLLAHELLIGDSPFKASNPHELIAAHLRDTPKRLSERRADVDPELDEIVARCLEKDAAKRPSAEEVARRLTPGGATLLEWPPPGLEELHGQLRGLSSLYWWSSVAVLVAILSSVVGGALLPSATESSTTMLLLVLAVAGAILLGVAAQKTVRLLLRASGLVHSGRGYAWMTILETLADARRDTGNVISGSREYAALKAAERDRLRRDRVRRELGFLVGGFIPIPLLVLFLTLGSAGIGRAAMMWVAVGVPFIIGLHSIDLALREAAAFRKLRTRKRDAEVDVTRLAAPWYESFEAVRVGQRLGRGVTSGPNSGRVAAAGLVALGAVLVIVLVPLTIVATLGPGFWGEMVPKFANTKGKAFISGPTRPFRVQPDSSITPKEAGRAFYSLLVAAGGEGSSNGFDQLPPPEPALPKAVWSAEMPAGLFPQARPNEAQGLPATLRILTLPPSSFSAAEMAFLEKVARAPHWKAFATVARAPRVDFVGGRFRIPFADTLGFWDYPVPRFAATKELAYASISRAAYFLARGQRDSAEATLRTTVSFGWAIADHGNTLIDHLIGIVIAGIGRQGLIDYYKATGDPRGAQLRARTDSVIAIVEAVGDGTLGSGVGPDLSDPRAARQVVQRSAISQREQRGMRFEMLAVLAGSPCTNLRELVFGPAADVREAFDSAYVSWARFPSDSSMLDMIYRTPERLESEFIEDRDDLRPPARVALAMSQLAGAILRNSRVAGCTALLVTQR